MTPWWVPLLGIVLTGASAWAAKAWAERGTSPDTLTQVNTVAMGMVKELKAQLDRVEAKADWRTEVHAIDRDHIDVLEDHIWRQQPPPPPLRPGYPPRPVA